MPRNGFGRAGGMPRHRSSWSRRHTEMSQRIIIRRESHNSIPEEPGSFQVWGRQGKGRGRGEETVRGREREISRALPRKGRFARASGGETRKGQGAHGDKTGPRRCGAQESRGAEPRAVTGGPRETAPDEKQMRNILGGCGLTASYDSIPGLMLRWLHVCPNLLLYLYYFLVYHHFYPFVYYLGISIYPPR